MTGAAGDDPLIEVVGVWRRYRVASPSRPQALRAAITRRSVNRRAERWMWALRGVDLEVHRGEIVGLIGRNGAGKSTLLRLLGRVGRPDRGSLAVHGRIAALVDLGHELHLDLTGRQNAEVAGVIGGLTLREVREALDEIIAFAELADFIDEPLRAYSDGMRARLAFSVVAHLRPDVLLVDEALAVGDAPFQRRATERMAQLRAEGTSIVVVSHDLGLVRRMCDRAAWLDRGQIVADGRPEDVVAAYLDVVAPDPGPGEPVPTDHGCIREVRLLDEWGRATTSLDSGSGLTVEVETGAIDPEVPPRLSIRIVRSELGTVVVDTSTPLARAGVARVSFDRLDLAPGGHRIEVSVHTPDWAGLVDAVAPLPLDVHGLGPETALLDPPHEWSHRSEARRPER